MKRIFMMLSVLSLVILLSGCFGSEEVDDALDIFCNDNPGALVCTNPEATRNEIVANMFNTMMIEFMDGTNEDFCDDYFSATNSALLDDCKNDRFSLVPEDIEYLSDDIVITTGDATNEYIVTTVYEDGSAGFVFTVEIVEEDGVIRFSEFSYEYDSTVDADLYLSDDYIKQFMVKVINESDDGDSDYCSDYFTGAALTACNSEISSVVPSVYVMYHPVVTELGTNYFSYQVDSFDVLEVYIYLIDFTEVDGEIVISKISFSDESTYNSIENAQTVLEDFLYDFEGGDDLTDLCDERIDGGTNIAECKTVFSGVFNTVSTIDSFVEIRDGVYRATIEFAGIETTTIVFELFIVVGEQGMYDMHLDMITTDVLVPPVEYDSDDVFEMFNDYITNLNFHESIDDETFCSTYTGEPVTHAAHSACVTERQLNSNDNVYIFPYYLSKDMDNVNKYTIYVFAYTADKVMEYAYYVNVYEGSLGHLGFSIESKTETDVTASKNNMTLYILKRYQDYAVDYLNTGITNDNLFEDYLFERYTFDALGTIRNEDISNISSITVTSIVLGDLKDGYFHVTVNGLVDFVDPLIDDFVISQSGRIYFVMTEVMLFPLEIEEITGADIFEISETEAAYFVMEAYSNYYTGAINCNYYCDYANPLTTSCETTPTDLFGDEIVVSAVALRTTGNNFTVTRYYYDDSNVLQSLSDLFVEINSYDGYLNFDGWYAIEVFTPEVVNTLITDYITDLLDPTITNTAYCSMYGIDDDCSAVRADLLASTTTVTSTHETVLIDGLEVQQVTIIYTIDGVEQTLTYNLDFKVNDLGEYEVGDVEDALSEVTMTLIEANNLIDQFVIDYNNSSMTNEQLADKYFALTHIMPEFFSERTIYFTEGATMVKGSLTEVSGELFYNFIYTVGTDSFDNTLNIYMIVDGVYNLQFLDYLPAVPQVPELSEAETIMALYFNEYTDLTISDSDICDKYYDGAVDCLVDRELIVNGNRILFSSVIETTTGEVDHFTVVYFLNSFMENRVVTWDLTIVVNPDGTYLFEELDKVVSIVESYLLPNTPPFDIDFVNDFISDYYRDYFDYMLTSAYVCTIYSLDEITYPSGTQTWYDMCIMERDADLTSYYYNDLVSIIYDFSSTDFVNDIDRHVFATITHGVTTASNGNEDVFTREYLYIVENADSVYGYYIINLNSSDETVLHVDSTDVDTVVDEILAIYLDESKTSLEVCNTFGRTLPGNNCVVDRGTHVGNSIYSGYYVTYNLGYEGEFIVEINLNFIDSSGESIIVILPMVFTEDINATYTAYIIDGYYYYLVPSDLITQEEFNALANDFLTDYINPVVTQQYIMDNYTVSGMYYLDRTTDLSNLNHHVVVETFVSHLQTYGSFGNIIIRAGVEGSYTYETFFIEIYVNDDGEYRLNIEYTTILK